jgi:hypothetical protein
MSLKKKGKKRTTVTSFEGKSRRTPMQETEGRGDLPDYDDRKNVFYTPKEHYYADLLSIRSEKEARNAVRELAKDFKVAKKQGNRRWMVVIRKGMDNTGKRAALSAKRTTKRDEKGRIGTKEQAEMRAVAKIYKDALKRPSFKMPSKQKKK